MESNMQKELQDCWDKHHDYFDVPKMDENFKHGFEYCHGILMPLLIEAMPHVLGSHGAEHMLDGFRSQRRSIDDLVERIKAVLPMKRSCK